MATWGYLGLIQTGLGLLIDQRAVVLYSQPDDSETKKILDSLEDATDDEIAKKQAELSKPIELFRGLAVPYLSDINGINALGVSYLTANIEPTSELAEHPVETGTMITDAAIINPLSAKVRISLPRMFYTRIYSDLEKNYFIGKKKIILQTKLAVYKNMVLQNMPHDLTNETVDRVVIDLDLRQVIDVAPQMTSTSSGNNKIKENTTKNASDADTVNEGRLTDSLMLNSPENDLANAMSPNGPLSLTGTEIDDPYAIPEAPGVWDKIKNAVRDWLTGNID